MKKSNQNRNFSLKKIEIELIFTNRSSTKLEQHYILATISKNLLCAK